MRKSDVSRRQFFKWGLGAVGGVASGSAYSQVCSNATASQLLGPFFPSEGTPVDPIREDTDPQTPPFLANDNDLTFIQGRDGRAEGQQVIIKGRITDENCESLVGATLVIWQASKTGKYNHLGDAANENFEHPETGEIIERKQDPFFQYWGRGITNENGEYEFKTIVPGFYPANLADGWYRPPHIHFMVSATGKNQFVTQMYFRGDEIEDNDFIQSLNEEDLLLQDEDLSDADKEGLIVDFHRSSVSNELEGLFNLTIK